MSLVSHLTKSNWALVLCLASIGGAAQGNPSQNETIPGKITTPYPTIHNLAIEWEIQGDDNLNGMVTVHFRKTEEGAWRKGMDLRRVPAGKRYMSHEDVTHAWKNKHSGSLFDLEPDTEYEIRLVLSDPDGGEAEKTVRVRTRKILQPAPDAKTRIASPGQLGSAKPGEIILLQAGDYGDFRPPADGLPNQPIVYRSEDGKAVFRTISLVNRKHVHLEGVTVRKIVKADIPKAVAIDLIGAENCVVRGCTVDSVFGICAQFPPGATNCYVVDNKVTGIVTWTAEAMGSQGDNVGEGIQMCGPGNVICYNHVKGFRDCISTIEGHVGPQICVDIYNNDIYDGVDDGIEADFCFNNCRIMRNRLTNCYVALSSQPGLGGPTYFIRNAAYNSVHAAFKLKRDSVGDVVLHNTIIKIGTGLGGNAPMDYAYFRNNLCIGGPNGDVNWGGYGAGRPMAADVKSPGKHSSFDYDAVGVDGVPFEAEIGGKPFSDVEPHGIRVDMSVFDDVKFPFPPVPGRQVADLRPRLDSKVVDAAVRIPNVNDDYREAAPDIGAYEAGQVLPHYGPRPASAW